MPDCGVCGEPMPAGEEMFKYHGMSGPCPKPPKPVPEYTAAKNRANASLVERREGSTPGPWRFDTFNYIWGGPDNRTLVAVLSDHRHNDDERYAPEEIEERSAWFAESANNASLIESIPELLDALEQATATNEKLWGKIAEVLRWCDERDNHTWRSDDGPGSIRTDALRAILHEALPSDYQESKVL